MALIKLPGLIDCHVHLRDPGAIHKEDFKIGTKAAVAGGITTVCDMPNNPTPTTTLHRLNEKIRLAKEKALCQIFFHFGADQNNFNQFSKIKNKVKSLKVYMDHTTGSLLIEDLGVLTKIFQTWPKNLPITVHAEDATMLKVIGLINLWGNQVHFCHISQASEIEMIKKAKRLGLPITCGVTPHHLFLTEKDYKQLGPFGMMRPPLRSKKNVESLWKNLKFIDCFETDHAPHTKKEKKSKNPPNGVPGLETALPLLLTAVSKGKLTIKDIILRYFKNPAKIFNIKQGRDTYIEIDLNKKWQIRNKNLLTKCGWSPFDGWKVQGKAMRVFIKGRKVFENGEFL